MDFQICKFKLLQSVSGDNLDFKFDIELIRAYQKKIKDPDFYEFLFELEGRDFFLSNSLQFYNFSSSSNYRNIETVNQVFSDKYGELANNLISIGQDIFGNQFVFDIASGYFLQFNCETGDKSFMGKQFQEFIINLTSDIEYYSGESFLLNFKDKIELNQRLCPKKPFTIGGGFEKDNLFVLEFPKYLYFYADIAEQLHNLPEGTRIVLKVKN